jgi:hypothetical protein
MGQMTSPLGSIELAITALLLVLGYRLLRPSRARDWLGIVAYAAGLVGQLIGASGFLHGAVLAAPAWQRLLGTVTLVVGLLLAGAPARARRRSASAQHSGEARVPLTAGHLGLALIVAGQFLRGPSTNAVVPTLVAVAVNVGVAIAARRGA